MKKLITGVLATLACLACFTPCVAGCSEGEDTPTSSGPSVVYDATGAAGYLEAQYKEKDKSGRKDYELPNTAVFQGNTYTVEWKVGDKDGNAITGVQAIKGETTTLIDVDVTLAADLDYTLFATVTDVNGDSATIKINRKVVALAQLVPLAIKEAPVAEKAYKFHVYQGANGTDIYLNGQIANKYYLGTTTEYDSGIDVYVEAVDGKEGTFRMYFNETSTGDDGEEVITKKYIDVVQSGTHTNAKYNTEAESVKTEWVFDAEYKTMVTTLDGTKFYLGADGTYETVEPQSKREEGYYMGYLVGQIDRANATAEDQVNQTVKELSVGSTYAGANTLTLSSNEDRIYPDAKITWAIAEPVEGVSVSAPSANNESVVLTIADRETAATVKLTATVTYGEGEAAVTATQDFEVTLAPNTTDGILAAALAMKDGASFGNEVTLEGQITNIQTPFDSEYGNVTVDMVVNGKTVTAYRLVGTGADTIGIGDTVSVSGILTNYKGAVQFDKGCTIVSSTEGNLEESTLTAAEQITAAYALDEKDSLTYRTTLTGVITKIGTAYDADNENITVTIVVDGDEAHPIDCYRLSGEGAETLKVTDTITVEGVLTRHNSSTVQFRQGCTFSNLVPGAGEETYTPPVAESTLTIPEAVKFGNTFTKDNYSEGKYFVIGKILEVTNATYGNMTIVDENDNKLTIYGTYDSTGANRYDAMTTKPDAGDTVKLYGVIGYYNAAQMQNAWIMEITEGEAPVIPDPVDISIADAIAKGEAQTSSTTEKYYLTGEITEVQNTQYGNVVISDGTNSILIYGLYSADGSVRYDAMETKPVVGDTIKVVGVLGQYNGTAQMKNGWLVSHTPGASGGEVGGEEGGAGGEEGGEEGGETTPSTPAEIVDAAYALGKNETMADQTLTGVITKIDSAWSTQFSNISVVIVIDGKEDKPILCYHLVGGTETAEAIKDIKPGDTITVSGTIKNYNGTIEFDSGSTLDAIDTEATVSDAAKVLVEKNALSVNTEITAAGSETLAIVGAKYSDVAISWASDNACAVVDGATVTYSVPDVATTVILTATVTLGAKTETVTFKVSVAGKPVTGSITVNKVMADMATANGWDNKANVAETPVALDDVASFKILHGSYKNSGKYYSDGIRIYSSDNPAGQLTISLADGYELVSVKISTHEDGKGFLHLGSDTTTDYSNVVANVSGSSVTFTAAQNTAGSKSEYKQVRILAIEVVYKAV